MREPETVAVLGTGLMGSAIARNLLTAGYRVQVWNRTPAKLAGLVESGAIGRGSPAEAVAGADFIITMLASAHITHEVISRGGDAAIQGARPGAVWVQMGTMGRDGLFQLEDDARAGSLVFVDAPVIGTKEPAERGELVILAAGPEATRERLLKLFHPLARRVIWLEHVGMPSLLKLVVNKWIIELYEMLAESMALAKALELDPALFVEALEGGPTWPAGAKRRADMILADSFDDTSFSVSLALKDVDLIRDVAREAGIELPLLEATGVRLEKAVRNGLGDKDIAALIRVAAGG